MSVLNQRTGQVWVTDYDRGVVETLGAEVTSTIDPSTGEEIAIYAIKNMPGVASPPDFDGVPVYFSLPDEVIQSEILPSIVVRRDDIVAAMSRWHLGGQAYYVPAPGANELQLLHPITGEVIKTGFDEYEYQDQAVPHDLIYTIQIRARYRNNLRVEAMKMLHYVMKKYQPYTTLYLKDSLNELRSYDAFQEGQGVIDEKDNVTGRFNGFNLTLRVEGELDLNDPVLTKTVTSHPLINYSLKKK